MSKTEAIVKNILLFSDKNNGDFPKYIMVNPEYLEQLKAEQVFMVEDKADHRYEFMGVEIKRCLDIEDFYLVAEFENQFHSDSGVSK